MLEFDRTVGVVFDFANKDKNTTVVITADHEKEVFQLLMVI
jgi:alkaline phosphatase